VERLVHEALELYRMGDGGVQYNTIVAAGGDGTLNEVVGAMLKHQAPPEVAVALLPLGTSNDFACATAISMVRGRVRRGARL
jgi:diacylglycerol kinase family enzyme